MKRLKYTIEFEFEVTEEDFLVEWSLLDCMESGEDHIVNVVLSAVEDGTASVTFECVD